MVDEPTVELEGQRYAWAEGNESLVQKVYPHSRLQRSWQPAGGVSAQVTALEIEHPGGEIERLIVRQHGERDRQRNPHIAADEFRLLQILQAARVPAPEPVYLGRSGEFFPHPVIVMEFVEGTTDFHPLGLDDALAQMATTLAAIHHIAAGQTDLSFLPEVERGYTPRPTRLDDSLHEGEIREALESVGPPPVVNPPVLLHGDFWPGNLLWRAGQLAAVIDWEDAAVGDPLADVANARLELLWAFGREAMARFTQQYKQTAQSDFTPLAYWDLCAALRPAGKLGTWGLDAHTEASMRSLHRWFVEQALTTLLHTTGEHR